MKKNASRPSPNLVSNTKFFQRVALSFIFACLVLAFALTIGVVGYHLIADLEWIDALLNASMILTGMGPVAQLTTVAAKVFASVYALFSGVVFLSLMGLVLTPILHRLLHCFHIDDSSDLNN